jgi:hypothetical protein
MIPTATAKYETGLLRYLLIYKDERINVRQPGLYNRNTYTMIPTATAKYETSLLRYLSIYKDERINLRQPGLHNRNTSQIKTHKLI